MSVEVLNDFERAKQDSTDDSFFYSQPRFVNHLDQKFRSRLTDLYREKIPEGSVVLDLMSSWVSHLPYGKIYKRVIGHGLNITELSKNKQLDSYWVQDLNKEQKLPLEDASVDACLMVAAWQYLQYPEEIAVELRRIIKPKGKLIISFSNRAFWTKAPQIWREGTDQDHFNYIKRVLMAQDWPEPEYISEKKENIGLFPFFVNPEDPFFCVLASNN